MALPLLNFYLCTKPLFARYWRVEYCAPVWYNPGQNYVDTSSRKAFLRINRTPTPPNNIDAMIFIFTCLHNILEHNIVKGGRGIKERTANFTFFFKKLVKSYCPHSFWPGLYTSIPAFLSDKIEKVQKRAFRISILKTSMMKHWYFPDVPP